MCHSVRYKRYTKLMTIPLIENVTYWLNHFPSKNGVSQSLSPANIVIGRPKPNFNHKKITFGSYAMVYTSTTSTMKRRSVPAIALKESNDHGGFFFMSLHTGRELHAYEWDELPINNDVIQRVEDLAKDQKIKKS